MNNRLLHLDAVKDVIELLLAKSSRLRLAGLPVSYFWLVTSVQPDFPASVKLI